MKALGWFLVLVLFLLAATWSQQVLPGYVLIRIGGWAIETSVLLLLGLVLLIYGLLHLTVWLWRMPGNSVRKLVERRSRAQLELGMLALAEGDWRKAEKALKKSARNSQTPAVSYIAAAQAAHGPGADNRRDEYLQKAEQSTDSHQSVVMTRAQLLLADDDPRAALALLEQLPSRRSRPRALELLAQCYERLGRWVELNALAPDLVRHGIIDTTQAQRIEHRALRERLDAAEDFAALQAIWQSLPRNQRREPGMITEYTAAALRLGHGQDAEPEARKALSREWSEPLGLLYGRIEGGEPAARLKAAESWLGAHPDSAALHLTVGRLCMANQIWGKAREHLDRAIELAALPAAYEAMGRLHEQLGETSKAATAYRRALEQLDR